MLTSSFTLLDRNNEPSVCHTIPFRVKTVRDACGAVGSDGGGGDADDSLIATH